jgi:hypothetical protein
MVPYKGFYLGGICLQLLITNKKTAGRGGFSKVSLLLNLRIYRRQQEG